MKVMKSYIIKTAFFIVLALCAKSAFADEKGLLQKGEQVIIGDSINGRMLRYSPEGVLHTLDSDAPELPSECRIVFQDNDTVWMENMFAIHTENAYHFWLKGLYIKDAKLVNPLTSKEEPHDIIALIPSIHIDFMEWISDDKKYKCYLTLSNAQGRVFSDINADDYTYANDNTSMNESLNMDSYIKFIIEDDMRLEAIGPFGEERTGYTTYYNYDVTCPYGINLNKLAYQTTLSSNGYECFISNLKLTPIATEGK